MTPSPRDDLELWAGYVHGGFVFKGTKKAFNGFESQRAVSLSQTSSEVWSEKKGRGSWDQLQRCFWVLPVLAWRFHRGQFHSRWQRPAHYHLCPALWWERCLFQFGSGPLKEKRERERDESSPARVRTFQLNLLLNTLILPQLCADALGQIMEYWSFSCVLINHKGGRWGEEGEKKKCCCNEICSVLPTAGVLTHSAVWISQSDYALVVGEGCVCRRRAISHSGLHASVCLTHTDG